MNSLSWLTLTLWWCTLISASRHNGPRIFGGHIATITEAPFMAFIGSSPDGKLINPCGGVIVQANLVLTSVRCVPLNMTTLYVRYGTDDYSNRDALTFKIGFPGGDLKEYSKVVQVYPGHSGANPNEEYDLAIIKLPTSINITSTTRPITLEEMKWPIVEGKPEKRFCRVYGFGLSSPVSQDQLAESTPLSIETVNTQLKYGDLFLRYKMQCQCFTGSDYRLCTDLTEQPGVIDDLDFGGPVVCDGVLTAIVSTKGACGGQNVVETFTYLYLFHDWIMKMMGVTNHVHMRGGSFATKIELPRALLSIILALHLLLTIP